MNRTGIPTLMLALLGIAWAPIALAQAQTVAEQSTPSQQKSAPSYSDEEVHSFAVAALAVEQIKAAYVPKLVAAQSAQEQQKLHDAASRDMVQAVTQQGMSVDKYKEMLVNAQTNPALAEKVNQNIKEHLKEPGSQGQEPGNHEPGNRVPPDDVKQKAEEI